MSKHVAHQCFLVLGGARSGKSRYAQTLAERRCRHPLYLATAEVLDQEMAARVELHRAMRGERWQCAEEPLDIAAIIREGRAGCDGILVDCLTLWVTNILLKEGADQFERRKTELVDALNATPCDVILVANEVGLGIVPESALGRLFRDLAGTLNQAVAGVATTVVFVAAGLPLPLKGTLPV